MNMLTWSNATWTNIEPIRCFYKQIHAINNVSAYFAIKYISIIVNRWVFMAKLGKIKYF